MKKAVIFDLDGTLVDSLESIAYCSNKALQKFGFCTFPKDRFRYFAGDGAAELIRRCLKNAGDETLTHFEEVYTEYKKIFAIDCMYGVKIFDGMLEVLQTLKIQGVKIAVLSNKPHARALDVVNQLFGEDFFDIVQGETPEINIKPCPDGALQIAKRCKISVKDCLYVGDTNTDMQTGKAAGMFTVGVLWGFRDKAELLENGADALVSHPNELLQYV